MKAPHQEISTLATISALADIETSSKGSRLTVGDGSFIDSFVKIKFAGGLGDVSIGRNAYINSGTVIYSGHGVSIGDDVLIAANCTLAATNHAFADPERPIRTQGFMSSRGGILVEDDAWLGAGVVLLDGAVVRRGAVIASGSVIRGEVEAYTVVAGSPPRVIGSRTGV